MEVSLMQCKKTLEVIKLGDVHSLFLFYIESTWYAVSRLALLLLALETQVGINNVPRSYTYGTSVVP